MGQCVGKGVWVWQVEGFEGHKSQVCPPVQLVRRAGPQTHQSPGRHRSPASWAVGRILGKVRFTALYGGTS